MKFRKTTVSLLAGMLAAVMALTLFTGFLPGPVSAASSGEIRKQINALKKQRTDIQKDIDQVKEDYKKNEDELGDIVARKNVIDQEIGLLHAEIMNIEQQISAFNVMIADKQDELDTAQDRLEELENLNRSRIRTMEEEGDVSYWEVVFKANSFSDLLDRLNMVEEIAASDKRRLQDLAEAAEDVSTAQAELSLQKEEVEAVRKEQDIAQQELDGKRREADDLIAELISKGFALEDLEEKYKQQKIDLQDEIAQKEKEYNQAKHAEWVAYMATYVTQAPSPDASGGGGSGGGGGAPSSSGWLVPCSYRKLTSPFGHRKSPTAGASTFHQGVDLGAPGGTPIYASRTGVVTTATFSRSAGYYVSINHGDGFSSIYMHMTNFIVSPGQAVSAGQVIGYVGNTGISTGYHLHFGIAYNGAYVNPALYIPL